MPPIAPATFSTARLIAERIEKRHFEDLRSLDGDPEVGATLGGTLDEAATRQAIERSIEWWERHGFGPWAFYVADTREFVGRGTLQHFNLDGDDVIETGYALRPLFWNQGYATEMATGMLKIAFEHLGKGEIYALTLPANLKSQRVMQKSGLTYQRDFMYKDKWPSVLYRITAREWQSRQARRELDGS